jgi:hypothetical protein
MHQSTLGRLRLVRIVLSVALILGLAITYKLWLTSGRLFPHTPVLPFLPQIPYPADLVMLGALIAMLLLAAIGYQARKTMIASCILFAILMLLDWNRWQPWAYQYFWMLLAMAAIRWDRPDPLKERNVLNALRLVISGIYLYSGLQKLNPNFFNDTYPWLLEPLQDVIPDSIHRSLLRIGYAFPAVEIFMGLGLLAHKTRRTAIVLAVIMHTLILIDMSPLGHNYNYVIWPWNIAMIFLVVLLFNETVPLSGYRRSIRSLLVFIIFLLFWIMPFLSFFNLWDSYLSASLYSGNTSSGVIYLSDKVKEKLPQGIKKHVRGTEGQHHLTIKYWSMMEMGVPGYPEKRLFKNVRDHLYKYADDPSEITLIYTERAGLLGPEKTETIE